MSTADSSIPSPSSIAAAIAPLSAERVNLARVRRIETTAGQLIAAGKALFTVANAHGRDDEVMLGFDIPKALEMLRRVHADLAPSEGTELTCPAGALTGLLQEFTCAACDHRLAHSTDGRVCLNPACDLYEAPDDWTDVDA